MKFKNFNIEDVFGFNDIEQAEKYLYANGYFANDLEDLDDLTRVRHFSRLMTTSKMGRRIYITEQGNSFKYFLPLEKVKKTQPVEDKVTYRYRPFRTVAEVDELLAKDSVKHYCFVGSDLYLRYKANPNITKHIEITNLEVDTNTNELRFINGFTPRHLAKNFDIKIAGRWLPFGVIENE